MTQQGHGAYEPHKVVKDTFQDIQSFRDQYMAMQKVCDELGLRLGRCIDDVKAVLKGKCNYQPSGAQLNKATDKIRGASRDYIPIQNQQNTIWKLIKEMENNIWELI